MDVYSLSSTVALFLVSLLVVYVCLDVIAKRRFILKYAKNTAVVPYLPIVGSAHQFLGQGALPIFLGWWEKLKTPFFYWMINVPHYFTNEPSEIIEVLTNPNTLEKGIFYEFVKPLFFDSLLTAEVSIWKKKRRFLSRGFTLKTLMDSVPVFNKTLDKLIATMHQKYNGDCVEIIERFAADTFMESICDIKVDEVTFDMTLYKELAFNDVRHILSKSTITRYMRPWLYPDIIFLNTEEGRECQRISRCLDIFLEGAIEERRKVINDNNGEANKSLIDIMIKEDMSHVDILAEMKQFLLGAAETSAPIMALALNLLAMHPDIQEKVLREILDVVGPDGPVEYKDIPNLKFTEMVIQETLRLFPPGPIIIRTVLADLHIGTWNFATERHKRGNQYNGRTSIREVLERPLKFNPDRFLPEEAARRPPGTFLPFSLGSRNCIGGKYAMILMKVTIARLVRNYKITTKVRSIQDFKVDVYTTLVVEGIDYTLIQRQEK